MIHQSQRGGARGDIAANDFNVRVISLDPTNAIQHTLRVAVRGIHHQHVHASFCQQRHTLFSTFTHTDGSAGTQTSQTILARQRMLTGFQNILDRHQPAQFKSIIDHQNTFEAVLVHQIARIFQTGIFLDRDQTLSRRHDILHRLIQIVLETQIPVGNDTDYLLTLNHRQTGNFVLTSQPQHMTNRHIWRNSNRVFNYTAFKALDLGHFSSLFAGSHVFMDDTNTTFLSQCNRQTRTGNGIHRSRQQRYVQADITGQLRAQTDVARHDIGVSGNE